MGIRRTRDQKVKAQQRRTELFEWHETVETSAPKQKKKATESKKVKSTVQKKTDDVSARWLRVDLTRTALATIFIIVLIAIAFWLSR